MLLTSGDEVVISDYLVHCLRLIDEEMEGQNSSSILPKVGKLQFKLKGHADGRMCFKQTNKRECDCNRV